MPSKRTNDSVDRILQDLHQQQTAAGVRDTVTDHQVDEILRSVGIPTAAAPAAPPQGSRIAFSDQGGFDDPGVATPARPAPAPARSAPASARPAASAAPAANAAQVTRPAAPVQPAAPQPAVTPSVSQDSGTLGDTTRTGIIKGFLLKMAPESGEADTDALNQGKNQFQKFFRDSVAVVPDEKGKIREPGKKKRGIFGLKSAEDTDQFVPIHVSLSGAATEEPAPVSPPQAPVHQVEQPAPEPDITQEEYFPDQEREPIIQAPAHKKPGFLGGLFGRDTFSEEIVIPEARQEAPPVLRPEPHRDPEPAAQLIWEDEEEEPEADTVQNVWHSKYTRPAASLPRQTDNGDTMEMLRQVKRTVRENATVAGSTATVYRKKRNTVEFTPGQKVHTPPPVQAEPRAGEPVGEPIAVPAKPRTVSGFTMQLGALDAAPLDSTQDFMNAYNAVRPQRPVQAASAPQTPAQAYTAAPAQPAPAPGPAETAPRQSGRDPYADTQVVQTPQAPGRDPYADTQVMQTPQAPGRDPYADTQVVQLPGEESLYGRREPDDVDMLVDTLTGKIRLTPEQPAHSGFTQDLSGMPAPAHSGFTQNLGGVAAPAHSGFTQNLGGAPAPAASGFTQNLGAAPAEPGTRSFVQDIAQAINTGTMDEDTTAYDEAAQRLTASLEEQAAKAPRSRVRQALGGLHLGGKAADEQADGPAPFETSELPPVRRHDYERAEDAPAVRRELAKQLLNQTTAVLVTGAIAAVLLVLGLLAAALPALPGPLADITVYPAVVLVLLLAAGGVCWRTVADGVLGLFRRPTPDSLTVLPLFGAVLQCIVLLAAKTYAGDVTLLAGPAVLVLCLNAVGKRMRAATIQENFRLVSAKVDHSVAYRLKDAGALRAVTNGLAQPHPSVLVNRPTQIFRSFLANSDAPATSDKNQQQFAWLTAACGLAAMLFALISTKDGTVAVTVLASVLCLGAPLAGTLLSALPARMMQRSAAQVGAVIPGWRDIRQLGRINVIQVTARDLFPTGCVTLSGIKPVKPEHIDLAIVYAASILAEAGPTLRDVFLGMLGENRNLLAKVEDRETIYGKGYVGWINKRRVLVGNRALMQDYGVKVPSMEYERSHTVNQRRVIYLAVSGKMFAMFQVAYQRDPDTAAVLDSLRRTGLSLVVDCDDFNCDVQLLEAAYSLPAGAVKVLSAAERETLAPAVAWLPESEGNMLHLGSFASFVGGLEAAAGAAEGEHKSSVLVSASVLFGCVLGVLLTLTGGLTTLPLAALVLYQAAWCVLALIFPLIQRY